MENKKMAEFCKKHVNEIIGTVEELKKLNGAEKPLTQKEAELLWTAWYCGDNGLCEECGYAHIANIK